MNEAGVNVASRLLLAGYLREVMKLQGFEKYLGGHVVSLERSIIAFRSVFNPLTWKHWSDMQEHLYANIYFGPSMGTMVPIYQLMRLLRQTEEWLNEI